MSDPEQPPPKSTQTIFEAIEWLKGFALYPAFPAMLLIRRNIGYRVITPNAMIVIVAFIIVGPLFLPNQTSHTPTVLFGIFLFGYYHLLRFIRWRELKRGTSWHTRSTGISWLESIPWPSQLDFLNGERRIYRFLDPIACFIAGWILIFLSSGLASCILISSLFLMIWEIGYYERYVNRILDIHDELIDADVQKMAAEYFQKKADAPALPLEQTSGLPTGLARDIAAKVEERKRRTAAPKAEMSKPQPGMAAS
jgi:hypothetical protein